MKTKHLAISAVVLALTAGACGGPPKVVKFTVKTAHIRDLSPNDMAGALDEKKEMEQAEHDYRMEKAKAKLRKLDYKLARIWYKAAKIRLKRIKLALVLKNKKVPVDLQPGALNEALQDVQLAKRNLEYRKLLDKFYKLRLKLYKWRTYVHKAQYMEKVVMLLHRNHHRAASKYPKFKFVRQSAKLKLKLAAIQEKVENAEAEIKALKKEIEPQWAPSLRRPPAPPTQVVAQPQPQAGGNEVPQGGQQGGEAAAQGQPAQGQPAQGQ